MIVDDPDLAGVTILPTENQPPLVVDPDRMKSSPLALERFEMISRRRPKIAQCLCIMKIEQFSSRDPTQLVRELTNVLALFVIVQVFSQLVAEGLYHCIKISLSDDFSSRDFSPR